MKKLNKKGFTIVELVIVIAVIAILAAVMIPTFSGIIEKANDSARLQLASAAYKEAYAIAISDDGVIDNTDTDIAAGDFEFDFTSEDDATVTTSNTKFTNYTVKVENGELKIEKKK